jgi:hypothetical protein
MIATTTVATTPTAGAMVIAATPAAAGTVRVAIVGAAVMMATAATARPAIEHECVIDLGQPERRHCHRCWLGAWVSLCVRPMRSRFLLARSFGRALSAVEGIYLPVDTCRHGKEARTAAEAY